MKIQKAIIDQTRSIAIGVIFLDVLMCLVFLIIGRFELSVIFGAVWGSLFAIGNFFFMGVAVQKAMDMGENARKYMQRNYTVRMLVCVAGMAAAIYIPFFHDIASLIPFLFPKIIIYVLHVLSVKKDESNNEEGGNNAE